MRISDEDIMILATKGFVNPQDIKPEYEKPRVPFLILDDLIANAIFSNKKNNFLNYTSGDSIQFYISKCRVC